MRWGRNVCIREWYVFILNLLTAATAATAKTTTTMRWRIAVLRAKTTTTMRCRIAVLGPIRLHRTAHSHHRHHTPLRFYRKARHRHLHRPSRAIRLRSQATAKTTTPMSMHRPSRAIRLRSQATAKTTTPMSMHRPSRAIRLRSQATAKTTTTMSTTGVGRSAPSMPWTQLPLAIKRRRPAQQCFWQNN